ncbi:MAG: peroxiredoxin [Patescibacteria group bacterium]|jgi:peroxiredoxin Q/BCP
MTLKIGDKAPEFNLPDYTGALHALADWAGQWVLVYFYPQDDTPGCTKEACSFRDNLPKFKNVDAIVVGISTDSVASHKKFVDKYGLPFTLLSDEKKDMVKAYGVTSLLGTKRSSFLVDPAGKIAKIYEHVKPAEHVEQVLNDLAVLI